MEKKIEKAIRETLVVQNKKSVKYAVDRILRLFGVDYRRELLYAFVTTMECDIKHETYEEDIEYFLKQESI